MTTSSRAGLDLNAMDEDALWEMIERHRYKIVRVLCPARLTPYLRQARVMDHLDEEEVLQNNQLTNSARRTGHLLDLLRARGKNGAIAFLESLKLHKPEIYTLITGKEPSLDLNSFSGLIETSKLTEFLVKAAESVQEELMEEKRMRSFLLQQCHKLKEKVGKLEGQSLSLQSLETELHRMRREYSTNCQEVRKLKEEKYDLSMRYANALQEKDLAMTRSRELQEQMDFVKVTLQRAEEKNRSLRMGSLIHKEDELLTLTEENERLRQLLGEKDMVQLENNDTLNLNPDDAEEGKQELIIRIHSMKERAKTVEKLMTQYLEEKEVLLLGYQQKEMDCKIYKEKMAALQIQVLDLQKERDQAYNARDVAQAQSSQTMVEKDLLRQQIIELQSDIFEQQHRRTQQKLESQQVSEGRLTSTEKGEVVLREKSKLSRMHAIYPRLNSDCSSISLSESWQDLSSRTSSDLEDSYRASSGTPTCTYAFNSHAQDDYLETPISVSSQTPLDADLGTLSLDKVEDTDSEYELVPGEVDNLTTSSLEGSPMLSRGPCCTQAASHMNLVPHRRHARRIHSRDTIIAFQGDALLEQLTIIGGNETGIFIHQVTPGSAADEMSLVPGSQIMAADFDVTDPAHKFMLEDVTMEEATWILMRVKGFCCLSIRYNVDRYRKLVMDLEKGLVTSGDSFYIRVNLALEKEGGHLPVQCGDILHITDTMYPGKYQWNASRVNPYCMKDTERGSIPNYYQAQQLLIRAIQDMSLQMATSRKLVAGTQKLVRVVTTERTKINPLWTSFDRGSFDSNKSEAGDCDLSDLAGSCFTLMPYTKVMPHAPTSLRPVLFVPSVVGRVLKEKLSSGRDFIICQSECLSEAEYAARHQRGDIISQKKGEEFCCCLTRQTINSAIEKNAHCLLDLTVDCVRALHQIEIYPIILLIPINEKNSKKLKKYLQRLEVSEELLLECSKREESLLDKLPCLYRTIHPESWNDMESLLSSVRSAVADEQRRTVWIEQELR